MKFNKNVKIADIAKAAGVSQSAVSRYINGNGYVSDEKKRSIDIAMEALDVRMTSKPSVNRSKQHKIFGLLIPPLNGNVQYTSMASFFSDAAKSRGYATKVYSVNLQETELKDILQTMLKTPLSGIFIPVVPMLELDLETDRNVLRVFKPISGDQQHYK